VPSVAAQSPGTFEFGGFARYANFDSDLRIKDKCCGIGGYLGVYFVRNLALEAEGSYLTTHDTLTETTSVSSTPFRARLVYNIPLGKNASAFQIGAGYVYDIYGKDTRAVYTPPLADNPKSHGVTGLGGFRFGFTPFLALRLSATVDYVPSPKQTVFGSVTPLDKYVNWGLQGGLSLVLNNDSDRDHVKDAHDKCPGTPKGEQADENGCSASQRDTDKDGVKDNLDKCPNTAAGQKVDAAGCSPSQLDEDADGVGNATDKCPGTPKGEQVDAMGCSASQRDADGDGVKDSVDKCPNTPKGEAVDAEGCSESQLDADSDGVPDKVDQCPNTPPGEPVDSRGCSRDSDADGVPDGRDKCPNTPNGQAVDENGCPVLFEGGKKSVTLLGVNFETGKSTLTETSKGVLKDVATSLAARPDVRVEVQGHTDNTGSRAANQRISKARAVAVEKFLEANGVSPAQLTAKGYGPGKPIASNKTKDGRASNRRVDLVRIK
jgi:outer membrane protein OmpA-like peptidoglycan-associated protein